MKDEADFYANYAENHLQDVIWGNWRYTLDEWKKSKEIKKDLPKDIGGLFDDIPF